MTNRKNTSKDIKVSRAVKIAHTDSDQVERNMTMNLMVDDSYVIQLDTQWPDDTEAFKTTLCLTPTGLDMLIALINHGLGTFGGSVPVTHH